jgi:hypothetical protein
MAIDPYAPCPGGTGKKVKFCCSDLVGELDKIQRMLEGDQRQACLDHIEHLEAKHPGRACLETTKALLQNELGHLDQARATLEKLLASQPDNPVALAESAIVAANETGAVAGIPLLHRAIAATGQQMSPQVYQAIGALAEALLSEGFYPAARGHLLLQTALHSKDETPQYLLLRIDSSPGFSLLLKSDPRFEPTPAGAPYQAEFDAALRQAMQVGWIDAAQAFTALAERFPEAPAIWKNLAVLHGWLAENAEMAAALEHLSTLDVPEEDAVEALATAQTIAYSDWVDHLRLAYPILDFDRLVAKLSSDRRFLNSGVDTADRPRDQPPPRAGYLLLERPLPATGVGMAREAAPNVLAQLWLFGRETDRPPRLEVEVLRTDLDRVQALLSVVAGDVLGTAGAEEVFDAASQEQLLFTPRFQVPENTPTEDVRRLLREHRRWAVLEAWPQMPQAHLGGSKPADLVGQAGAPRIKLQAALLRLELDIGDGSDDSLLNELRTRLGVPIPAPIHVAGEALRLLPPVRLARVVVADLSDDDLLFAHSRAMMTAARRAQRNTAAEVVRRPSLDAKVDKAAAYGMLAQLEHDAGRALEWLVQARAAAAKAGKSCARWDIEEFMLRVRHGDSREAGELFQHLQSRHGKEPAVQQFFAQMMAEMGAAGHAPSPAGEPSLVLPGGEPVEAGKIWTPESQAPQGKKSALWTPGMD